MIAATIRYVLPEGTDWAATRALLQERARLYIGMPGLIHKAFLYNPETREYGGNYVWQDRAALDAFLASDLVKGAIARFGTPKIEVFEIAACLDRGEVNIPEKSTTNPSHTTSGGTLSA